MWLDRKLSQHRNICYHRIECNLWLLYTPNNHQYKAYIELLGDSNHHNNLNKLFVCIKDNFISMANKHSQKN